MALDRTIFVVEGEKDVDKLWAIGVPATCNAHGASEPDKKPKWQRAHSEQLRGADIVIIPDNDPQGRAHAEAAASLSHGIAKRVRLLDLAKHWPADPDGGDISDWLAAGHNREELDALIEKRRTGCRSPSPNLSPRRRSKRPPRNSPTKRWRYYSPHATLMICDMSRRGISGCATTASAGNLK